MNLHRFRRPLRAMTGMAAGLLLSAVIPVAQAASADAAPRCAEITDDRARLACYDSLFGKPASSEPAVAAPAANSPASEPTSAPAATVATPATTAGAAVATAADPEADFGLTEAAKRAREPESSRQQLPESITGTVAKVARKPAGELVVTLENGQVWTQIQVDVRARIAVGDTVTIKKAALGSHMLVTASRYATRVRRVK